MSAFRRVCRWLHRELGYFAVGLTLVYAISGIAVNHAHHWDANYDRERTTWRIEPPGLGPTDEIRDVVLARLAPDRPVKSTWRAAEDRLQVFVEDGTYTVDLATGDVWRERIRKRPLFYEVNFMHLNNGKAPWTGIADAYGALLIVLAVTGIFLVKGRKGLAGRGGVLLALGIALPVAYMIWQATV
jgi:hypothetical protein